MVNIDYSKNKFNILMKISLIIYIVILMLAIMLKAIIVEDLNANFEFLSTFTLKGRFIRGIKVIEFYKIEYELGIIKRTIILDLLNCIVFIPFGILITNRIEKYRVLKTLLIALCFSIFIELFQLITIIGSFMLNDLIINVIGSIIGSVLYIFITKNKNYKIYNALVSVFIVIEVVLAIYLIVNFLTNINIYIELFKYII